MEVKQIRAICSFVTPNFWISSEISRRSCRGQNKAFIHVGSLWVLQQAESGRHPTVKPWKGCTADTKRGWSDCFSQSSGRSRAANAAKQAAVRYIDIIVKIVDLIEKKEKKNEHTSFTIDHNCPGRSVLYGQCIVFSVCSQRQAIIPCCLDVSHFVCFNSARQKASIRLEHIQEAQQTVTGTNSLGLPADFFPPALLHLGGGGLWMTSFMLSRFAWWALKIRVGFSEGQRASYQMIHLAEQTKPCCLWG